MDEGDCQTRGDMDYLIEGLSKAYLDSLDDSRIRGRHPMKEIYQELDVKLKPCPFCGGKAYLDRLFLSTSDGMDEVNGCEVGCRNCDIYFRDLWEYDDIVKRWNTRNV